MSTATAVKPDDKDEASETPARRTPLFEYPPLALPETAVYWTLIVVAQLYAWFLILRLSSDPAQTDELRASSKNFNRSVRWEYSWLLGRWLWRTVDPMWVEYTGRMLPWLIVSNVTHALLFNSRLCGQRGLLLCVWSASALYLAGPLSMTVLMATCALLYVIAAARRSVPLCWLCVCCCFALHEFVLLHFRLVTGPFVFSYGVFKALSFALRLCDEPAELSGLSHGQRALRLAEFVLHPPYLTFLFVSYDRWAAAMAERTQHALHWRSCLPLAARLTFWLLFTELMFTTLHSSALLQHRQFMDNCDLFTLAAVGFLNGHLFHLRQLQLFGWPTLFARLDGMQPLPLPTCYLRHTLFSKLWRSFDRGLYHYYKTHIYHPIMADSMTVRRRLLATVAVYAFVAPVTWALLFYYVPRNAHVGCSFVLLWHHVRVHMAQWLSLSMASILYEQLAKAVYRHTRLRTWRERYIGDRCFRRIIAFAQLPSLWASWIGILYLFGGSRVGWTYIERFVIKEILHLTPSSLLLMAVCYAFANVCIDIQIYEATAQRKKID